MFSVIPIASTAIIVIAVIALIYTLKIGKTVSTQKGEQDPTTKTAVKHRFLLNPVFLTYVIGFGGLLLLIFYFTSTWY